MNVPEASLDSVPTFPHIFRGEADAGSGRAVRLDELLAEMKPEIRSMAPARVEVRIVGLHERTFPWIALPASQVEELIRHLVIDAMDAMPAGGTLSIFIEHLTSGVTYPLAHPEAAPGNYVMLSVCDTGGRTRDGEGSASRKAASMLDKGRALGLSAAFEAIETAGGILFVSHRQAETAVRIYFPVADGH